MKRLISPGFRGAVLLVRFQLLLSATFFAGILQAQEIDVTGNGQSITSGSTITSFGDHTDFGATVFTGGAVTRTFTIENTGGADLTIGTITSSSSDFMVTSLPTSPVSASGSTTFEITYDPSTTGSTVTSTITIPNNDPDEGSYTFNIDGYGLEDPNLSVGDIAFTMFNGDGNDEFAFVALTDIGSGQVIHFMDHGWDSSKDSLITGSNEGTVTFESNALISAGDQVVIDRVDLEATLKSSGLTTGTVTSSADGGFNLSKDGDQILAFEGAVLGANSVAVSQFLSGIHTDDSGNGANGWTSTPSSTAESNLPDDLTNGADAISLYPSGGIEDNARYNGPLDLSTGALRLAINTNSHWTDNNNPYVIGDLGALNINNVPTVTAPSAPSVTEDDINVVLADNIEVNDVDGESQTLSFTITGGTLTIGSTDIIFGGSNGSASFTASGTIADLNSALDAATFTPDTDLSGTNVATIAFTSNDGKETSATASVTFSITGVNDPPEIASLGGDSFTYNEGSGALIIDQSALATLSDVDSPSDLAGGNLTVTIFSGEDAAEDQLSLNTSGTVSLSGTTASSTVSVGGNTVGTLGNNIDEGNDLVVNFSGANATLSNIQTLIQSITYENTDTDNPTTGARVVRVTVDDGDGGSSTSTDYDVTVTVAGVNDSPEIASLGGDSFTYDEGSGALTIDQSASATLSDVDSPSDLAGGNLTVTIFSGEDGAEDQLSLNTSGAVSLSGTTASSTVSVGGNAIGTLGNNIDEGNDLVVNFSGANATLSNIQTLIQSITYENTDTDNPTTGARVVRVTVDDGDGGSSTSTDYDVTVTVAGVNDSPEIASLGGDSFTYDEGSGALTIDQSASATLSDVDNPSDLAGGNLTVTIFSGEDGAEDQLSLNTSGAVSLSGTTASSTVSVGGNAIGTLGNNIDEGNDLVVNFSGANATLSNIQTLIQSITYENTDTDNPTTGARVVRVTVDDGDGGSSTSADYDVTMTVARVNDPPIVTAPTGAYSATEQIGLDIDGPGLFSVTEVDEENNTVTTTISVDEGLLNISAGGTGAGVSDNNSASVTVSGSISQLNQILSGTDGSIVYTANAQDPPSSATITVQVDDEGFTGSGGAETASANQTINITPLNDEPEIDAITGKTVVFAEGASAVDLFDGTQVTTVESGQNMAGFVMTITNVSDGAFEVLNVGAANIDLSGSTGSTGAGSFDYEAVHLSGTTTITFDSDTDAKELTEAEFNTLINNITYINTDTDPEITNDRVVTITSISDDGSNSGLNDNTASVTEIAIVDFVPKDNTSSINKIGGEFGGAIPYANYQGAHGALTDGNTVQVLTFDVQDEPGDPLPTIINQLTVELSSNLPSGIDDIRAIGVFDGTSLIGSTGTITASNDIALSSPISVPAEGVVATLSLRVSFADTVRDNNQFTFDITDAVEPGSGSSFVNTFNATSTGADNFIEVTATDLFFVQLDTTVRVNTDFMVTVQALDDEGSLDEDFNDPVTIVLTDGSGNLTSVSGLTQSATSGEIIFDDLRYDETGTFRLRATSGAPTNFSSDKTVEMSATNALSDVIEDPAFNYPVDIDYTQYDASSFTSVSDGLQVAQFLARDGGADGDDDTDFTELDGSCGNDPVCDDGQNGFGIQVIQGGDNIKQIALYATETSQVPGISNNTIVGQYTNTGDNIYVFNFDDDNGSFGNNNHFRINDDQQATLGVFVTFKDEVTDNEQIVIEIIKVMDMSGSKLANDNGAPFDDPGPNIITPVFANGENLIEVTGTNLVFNPDPSNQTIEREIGFDITVEAQDVNGNVDLDETSVLNLTLSEGAIETPAGPYQLSAGSLTVNTIVADTANIGNLTLTVTDADGNTGSQEGSTTLASVDADQLDIQDTVDPTENTLSPADLETDVLIGTDLIMTFSETVLPDIGNIVIVKDAVPPVSDEISANSSQVVFDGNQVTISPSEVLDESSDYYVFIEGDAFKDPGGNNFAGFTTETDWTFDTEVIVTMLSATPIGDTGLKLLFNTDIEIDAEDLADWTLVDGIGTPLTITDLTDDVLNNEELELVVDLSSAVGDLTLTYTGGGVTDISNTSDDTKVLGTTVLSVDLDTTDPEIFSAVTNGTTRIDVTFTDAVQDNSADPGDFELVDGLGASYAVSAIGDATADDEVLELTVADFSGAVGDLTLTYSISSGSIDDFGGNSLQNDATGIEIEFDGLAPTLSEGSVVNNTTIDVKFTEKVQIIDGDPPSNFLVEDGIGNSYSVSAMIDNVPEDSLIRLTVQSVANAIGDIIVTYDRIGTRIEDFGGNMLLTDATGVVIDEDAVNPTLINAIDNNGASSITLVFSEEVQITTPEPNDFLVTDGIGNTYSVNSINDGVSNDDKLGISVTNYSTAVGDLTITYDDDDDAGDIEDYGSNFLLDDLVGYTIDFDDEDPTIVSATEVDPTHINVTFDDRVQLIGATASEFTVVDGVGAPFAVSAINDATPQDFVIELTVADLADAIGDLTLTYATPGNTIRDFGGNSLQDDPDGVVIESDGDDPELSSVAVISNTILELKFNDRIKIMDGDPSGDFAVEDGIGNTYSVSAISDNVAQDSLLRLTIQSIINAVGDITVTYDNTGTDIQDFGGNSLQDNSTGVVAENDDDEPGLFTATDNNGSTSITLVFDEAVQISVNEPGDFTVVDGVGDPYTVTAIADAVPNDNELELTVDDYSGAVGDLTITYDDDDNLGDIEDFGSNFLVDDGSGVEIDFDNTDPTMTGATASGNTSIIVTFDDAVEITSSTPTDFVVEDGIGTGFLVSAILDGTAGDQQLILTVANFSAAVGDLTLTYSRTSSVISDFGGNTLQSNAVGVSVELDGDAPELLSASIFSNTTIDVTFTDAVQIVSGAPSGDFLVEDGIGNTYAVSAISDPTPNDDELRLTVQTIVNAIGDITVSYSDNGTDIQDFGGNSLATNLTGVIIDNDSSNPSLFSANDNNGSTSITIVFDEAVQISVNEPGDFTVVDGVGDPYTVTAIADAVPNDNELELTVDDYSGALGDLTITYNDDDDLGDIEDFGSNFLADDGSGVEIDFDNTDPIITGATASGNTSIIVTFNDAVEITSSTPTDFVVEDGIGTGFLVSAILDGTAEDQQLTLTVANFSAAVGDLTLTYSRTSSVISDFGGNTLQSNAVGVSVELDGDAPELLSASIFSNTTIDVTFTDAVQIVNGAPSGDFLVEDGIGNTYAVSAISDPTPNDDELRLTVQTIVNAIGDITVSYSDNGTDIQDFGGNSLATNLTGVIIDNDSSNPSLFSANDNNGSTSITLVFDEEVQITSFEPVDFTVEDGLGTTYIVSAIADGIADDEELELTVADYSGAVGDLTITYDDDDNAGDIQDYGSNFYLDDPTGVTIDFDITDPELASAAVNGTTQIEVIFSEIVANNAALASDFTVADGIGNTFAVSAINDASTGDTQLELTVADFSGAIGDLKLTYARSSGTIDDFGGNSLGDDAIGVSVELDGLAPEMFSAAIINNTTIDITFTDAMQIVSSAPSSDFSVVDGVGNDYVVSSISDNVANDVVLRISLQSLASAVGDIEITYATTGSDLRDFGGNALADDASGVTINKDVTEPEMQSASVASNTEIVVTFTDAVQIIANNPADFTVTDAQATSFTVSAVSDAVANDNKLELTMANISASVGDLIVTYAASVGQIDDFGGNTLASDPTGVRIERDLLLEPSLDENPTSTGGDVDSNVALYRSVNDPSGNTPVDIAPNIDGSTIRIYSDAALTNTVITETNVIGSFTPNVGDFLPTIDWGDAADDHGVYTFYITETAIGGLAEAEGPAVEYSIAFLDDLSFTTTAKTFRESDNIGVILSLDDHPSSGQDLLFTGNGLTNIDYNPGGTSDARFVPVAAGVGTHPIDITWENTESNVSATFTAVESFLVSEDVDLFLDSQTLTFCRVDGVLNLAVNNAPPNIDVDETEVSTNQDFYGFEVYFIENGEIKTDIPGDAAGEYSADGNIASLVLQYDPDNTVPPITAGVPTYTTGEWFFDPSAFTALGASVSEIDTLRFAYIVSANDGSSLTFISEENVYLFPDPTVTLANVENYYCEDETPTRLQARILTFEGGTDTTGVINTGYRLWYSPSDPTFAPGNRVEYDFTASGTLSNFWRPNDPNQNGNTDEDESGYYRIFYESVPQTAAGCTNSTSEDLQVISVADAPTISSSLSGIGGQDAGVYLLEFCEGDPLPTIEAAGLSISWFAANGTTVIKEGTSLDLLDDVFGGNQPAGGSNVRVYIRDKNILDNAGSVIVDPDFDGCASNLVEVNIRIRAIPPAPEATIAVNGDDAFNEEDLSTSDGRSYLYEYCSGDDLAGVDLSPRGLNVNNISDSRAHFLIIPEDSVLSNAVNFDANFIDWSADIFGGGSARDTTIYIALVTNDSIFAGGGADAFAGCTSEASTFELRISTVVVDDILTNEGGDFTTEHFTCFGDPITTIDIENGTYNWYTDNGDLTFSEGDDDFFVQGQDLTNNALLGTNTAYQTGPGESLSVNEYQLDDEAGIYYYWVRQVDNASDDSNFPGCESSPTLMSVTVFEEPLEPIFNGLSVANENDDDVDFEVFFCAADLNESVTFEASLNGFADGSFSTDATDDGTSATSVTHDFVWYTSNEFGDQQAFAASGSVVNAVDLGLITSNDVVRYIYLEQVENVVNDQNGDQIYSGCPGDGVVIKFTIFREPDAPDADENAYYYCADETIADLTVTGESNALFTWMVAGSPAEYTTTADGTGTVMASMDDLGIGQNPAPDSTYTIKVVQRTDDSPASGVPPISDAFVGCTSDTTEIQILVRSIPEPVEITTPLICADGQLVDIQFSGDQQANSFFIYPSNEQVRSLRKDTLGGNAQQFSFDLLGAEAGRDTVIYISQITDTDLDPDFVGCESALTPIPVYAKPLLGLFPGNNGLINDPKACSEIVQLEIELTNQGIDAFEDYTFAWTANNELRDENTELSASSPLLGGSVYSITMNETFPNLSLPVAVTVTDKDGCVATASRNIAIGSTPDPQFGVSNITAGNLTTFEFGDDVIGEADVQSLTFELSGMDLSFEVEERVAGGGVLDDPYVEDGFIAGQYSGTLTLISVSGCENTVTRSFKILSREVVPRSGVVHTFNGPDANGWISEALDGFDDRLEVWEAAPPAATNASINSDSEGGNSPVWITNADGNYSGDAFHYYVYSPAFDFTALDRPTVSFNYFAALKDVSDGVVFQWSTDDGVTWNNLGDYSDEGSTGVEWFTSEGISGSPGTIETNLDQVGWDGPPDSQWKRAVHSLSGSELSGLDNVRFRFAMGVRPGSQDDKSDGFAFDNFSIYDRDRITILETFTTSQEAESLVANDAVHSSLVAADLEDAVIWINYFTESTENAAQRDVVSEMNANDPEARLAFYGVSEVPTAALSGEVRKPGANSIGNLGFNDNDLLREVLENTEFDVSVATEVDGGMLSISASVLARPESDASFDDNSETSVRVLILQDEVSADVIEGYTPPADYEGDFVFRNRLVEILPSADGTVITGDLTEGQVIFDQTIEWEIKNLFGEANEEVDVTVVVFVQDEIDKDVYQVGFSRVSLTLPETVTGVLPNLISADAYDVYPNPGDRQFTIRMDRPVDDDMSWSIADYSGKEVKSGEFRGGATETVVNIEELASGVYLLKIFNASDMWQSKRVMVLRD